MPEKCNELCRGTFREEYHITEERILESLFEDPDFSAEESKKIVDEKNGRMIGFIGVKVSHNEQLYPASAWISIFAGKKRRTGKRVWHDGLKSGVPVTS